MIIGVSIDVFNAPVDIAIVIAIFVSTVVSLTKELWDIYIQHDNTPKESAKDFVADVAGLVFGILVGLIVAFS